MKYHPLHQSKSSYQKMRKESSEKKLRDSDSGLRRQLKNIKDQYTRRKKTIEGINIEQMMKTSDQSKLRKFSESEAKRRTKKAYAQARSRR